MSTDYLARSKGFREGFGVNVSGGQLLGMVHQRLGLPLAKLSQVIPDYFRVPFRATAEEAADMAARLRGADSLTIRSLYLMIPATRYFKGSADDFRDWLQTWIEFLETCQGYDVEPWQGPNGLARLFMASPQSLADTFVQRLQADLPPETLREIDRLNREETDPQVCHSHDFCDANQYLLDAVEQLAQRGQIVPEFEQLLHEDWAIAWEHEAWGLAKRRGFAHVVSAEQGEPGQPDNV